MPQLFEKYDSLMGKPNGRPVGVRNGQGQQPAVPMNPALGGMKHAVEGMRNQLVGDANSASLPYKKPTPYVQKPNTLQNAQAGAMRKQENASKAQTSVQKEVEVLNSWLSMFK